MCYLCRASISDPVLRYTNALSTAGWRSTLRTTSSWAAELRAAGKDLPVLLSSLVGLQLQHVMIDILHTVDQGVTSHVLGNIMRERMTCKAPTRRKQIDELNKGLTTCYADDGKVNTNFKARSLLVA